MQLNSNLSSIGAGRRPIDDDDTGQRRAAGRWMFDLISELTAAQLGRGESPHAAGSFANVGRLTLVAIDTSDLVRTYDVSTMSPVSDLRFEWDEHHLRAPRGSSPANRVS